MHDGLGKAVVEHIVGSQSLRTFHAKEVPFS
jgi:hypothetical protein